MHVVGTAGHVDHGKSTLVTALTGIDPDRLREEKERGMTIDLGFAWLRLPGGREVSVVDVPGHERFIKNMLAGVGGIDLALLIVAADEGPMPQTEEHLAILELLQIRRAIVVLTKRDLVDDDWLALVSETVCDRLDGSPLRGAPIVAVSALTGDGLPDLLALIDRALDDLPPKPDLGRPRVPVDRVFTVAGFGTVVTGTLTGGRLSVGQEIEVQPGNLKARARGLQTHKQKVDLALPGSRVAVNLGGLATTDLRRGQVVTTPGWLRPTRLLDASLTVLRSAPGPLAHNAWVTFHTGAAEATARVALLERDELGRGERGWAQIRLEEPVAVAKGDLFVIRTPNATIGGGEVVDAQARRHRRQQPSVVETLRLLQTGSPEELVMATVGAHRFTDVATVALRVSLAAKQATLVVERLVEREALLRLGEALMTRPNWEGLVADVVATLGAYHEQYPLRSGMSKEELRSRLDVPTRLHSAVLDRLAAGGHVVVGELVVALPGHRACFRPEQESAVQAGLAQVERGRFSPPSLPELGFDAEVVAALVEQGKLVRVSEAIVFAPSAYREMVERIRQHLLTAGTITVAEVRDMFDTSRRYALALLEHLDDQRVTRRVGDARVLR